MLTLHSVLAAAFPEEKSCKHCQHPLNGFTADTSKWSSCGDCLRRTVALQILTARGIWKSVIEPDASTQGILDALCAEFDLVYSYELADSFQKSGFSSQYFPLDKDPDGGRAKLLRERLDKERQKGGMSNTEAKTDVSSEEQWRAYYAKAVSAQRELDEECFVLHVPQLLSRKWDGWKRIDPKGLFWEEVDETVYVQVKFGNRARNMNEALSIQSIIENLCVPSLQKDGKQDGVNYLRQFSASVVDSSVGCTIARKVTGTKLRSNFALNPAELDNLFYTLQLHCGAGESELELRPQKARCQLHSLGMDDAVNEHHVVREDWIPLDYAVHGPPSSILAHLKPLLSGATQVLLTSARYCASLAGYLVSEARRVATPYTSLIAPVQQVLLAQYGTPDKIPDKLVNSLVGKDFTAASAIIFQRKEEVPTESKKEVETDKSIEIEILNRIKKLEQSNWKSPKAPAKEGQGKKPKGKLSRSGYADVTPAQEKLLVAAFGDYKDFLRLKKRDKLKGRMDLLKLANFYQGGKQKFGKKTLDYVVKKCSLN